MLKHLYISLFWLACWLFQPAAHASDDVELVTADLSPYSIEVGLRPGFLIEIISLIEDRLKTNRPVDFYPWPRAQMLARTQANRIIFPLTRTPTREAHFNWLLDVAPIEMVFVTLDGHRLTLDQARQLGRITVQQSTPFESFLKSQGFNNLISSPRASQSHLRLLEAKRVDAWFTAKDLAEFALMDETQLTASYSKPIKTWRVYIATSKEFPKGLADDYRRIFNELKADGTVDHILRQYRR